MSTPNRSNLGRQFGWKVAPFAGSHKRRDARCAIAAPVLKRGGFIATRTSLGEIANIMASFLAITTSLESCGWEVHDELDHPEHYDEPPVEEITGTDEERQAAMSERLKKTAESHTELKRALVLYNSHTGGHKFAGNVIVSSLSEARYIHARAHAPFQIYFPNGTGVWYGRVSSHEVGAVTKTVTDGRISPTLLRGGINLQKPKGKTLLEW